jgi:hypothetical protein
VAAVANCGGLFCADWSDESVVKDEELPAPVGGALIEAILDDATL